MRSVKEECLSKLNLFGEGSLRRALHNYTVHYHEERNHQGAARHLCEKFGFALSYQQPGT